MKKLLCVFLTCSLCSLLAVSVWADTLELKDGRLIEGQYMGGTQQTIRFQAENTIQVYAVKDVLALTFSPPVSALPTPTPSSAIRDTTISATPQPRTQEVVLTAGTPLSVSMLDTIDINTNRREDWFTGMLTQSVVLDGNVVIPKDTRVRGQVVTVQQDRNSATLAVELKELEMNRKIIPITTKPYAVEAKAETLIGTGTLRMVTRPRMLQIPYRSVVEFELSSPLKIVK